MSAARRYELNDKEWEKISPLLPPEKTVSKGRPSKDNKTMFNAIVWLARSGALMIFAAKSAAKTCA